MPDWRWIDVDREGGGYDHVLVEGEGLLPDVRVILRCGDLDSEDQDRIAASVNALADLTPEQVKAVQRLVSWYRNWFWKTNWNTPEAQAEYVALGQIFGANS